MHITLLGARAIGASVGMVCCDVAVVSVSTTSLAHELALRRDCCKWIRQSISYVCVMIVFADCVDDRDPACTGSLKAEQRWRNAEARANRTVGGGRAGGGEGVGESSACDRSHVH